MSVWICFEYFLCTFLKIGNSPWEKFPERVPCCAYTSAESLSLSHTHTPSLSLCLSNTLNHTESQFPCDWRKTWHYFQSESLFLSVFLLESLFFFPPLILQSRRLRLNSSPYASVRPRILSPLFVFGNLTEAGFSGPACTANLSFIRRMINDRLATSQSQNRTAMIYVGALRVEEIYSYT